MCRTPFLAKLWSFIISLVPFSLWASVSTSLMPWGEAKCMISEVPLNPGFLECSMRDWTKDNFELALGKPPRSVSGNRCFRAGSWRMNRSLPVYTTIRAVLAQVTKSWQTLLGPWSYLATPSSPLPLPARWPLFSKAVLSKAFSMQALTNWCGYPFSLHLLVIPYKGR